MENRELRQCLAEHQTVLEMVMNKFRRVSAHAARLERDYSTMADQNGLNEIKVFFYFLQFLKKSFVARKSKTDRKSWWYAPCNELCNFPWQSKTKKMGRHE